MEKEKVYVFKAALKYRKGLWRRIEIKGNQTLGDFDYIIRDAFNHDSGDHLSQFFLGRVWHSEGLGNIEPGGYGVGAPRKISTLSLKGGDSLEYVYDFGDDIQHIIRLEKIMEPETDTAYPCIIAKNKPRYQKCEQCMGQGKKTIATWICIECSDKEQREVLLCDMCMEKRHEDHYADEILY